MEQNHADQPEKSGKKAPPPVTTYQAYMLRLWQESDELPWRASLQNPHTGEQKNFATLAHLYAFLEEQTKG